MFPDNYAGIPFEIAVELIKTRRYQVSPAPAQVRFVHYFCSEFFKDKPRTYASSAVIAEYFKSADFVKPPEETRENKMVDDDPFESLLEGATY